MNERDISLLKAVGEAVKEQFTAMQKKNDAAMTAKSEEISELRRAIADLALQIEDVQRSVPSESDIVRAVIASVEVPSSPELLDVARIVTEAVDAIQLPQPPALPDIGAMVKEAVAEQVAAIELPQPQPLPDIGAMVKEAVNVIPVPELPALPDIGAMVKTAVAAEVANIIVPQPQPLPDIGAMVKEAVNVIPVPELPALPDIGAMVKTAVAAEVANIIVPQPQPLPDIGAMVKDAVSAIPPAKDGEPGTDGKDALQIEILPCIDVEKSHPRGTYAIHQGGLWRSYQKTTGMNGWECLVDGVSAIDISQNNEREFTVTAQMASGTTTEKSFSIPVMIYRDIFKEGEKYLPGDSVTWAGSVWYCCEETTDKPGEPGVKAWKLAVKRGRDARSKP